MITDIIKAGNQVPCFFDFLVYAIFHDINPGPDQLHFRVHHFDTMTVYHLNQDQIRLLISKFEYLHLPLLLDVIIKDFEEQKKKA